MIPEIRNEYNKQFTEQAYNDFLEELDDAYPGAIEFRLAETPVFVDKAFKNKMLDACESIVDFIVDPAFKELTEKSIPPGERFANETSPCQMLVFDFGICESKNGEIEPMLIEMQGFPSMYAFHAWFPEIMRKHLYVPENFTPYLGGYTKESFIGEFKKIISDDLPVENVVLLEIKPHEQKTRIDFYCTEKYTGIKPVCISELILEGRQLFYMRDGKKTLIKRIYNRVITDELKARRHEFENLIDITQDFDVEWIPHPNWFYRISKYTLPFLRHEYVPQTFFLNEIKQLPADLENYVLKPLFSFAGQGVVIDVTKEEIEKIDDLENWILQRKVQYANIIKTPDENDPAKAEIRIMYLWNKDWSRPKAVLNLARLSKGKMIGTRYNKNKTWVGGSVCFFEEL
ncbi:hypothetical protein [Pinibacter aurantiacus]|uniref:Circularly permuted type 2 ATP-grasp protein n=1 Tax=Pinibacter aurantiacus TaxID=2851599 RepID=A0A9E2S588_9BACT|nr:hypothetical protein [Pinibacter aurantiacus]MBV4356873.1 hypothetical protein [Pinibacter aurantiacus]